MEGGPDHTDRMFSPWRNPIYEENNWRGFLISSNRDSEIEYGFGNIPVRSIWFCQKMRGFS